MSNDNLTGSTKIQEEIIKSCIIKKYSVTKASHNRGKT